ncbi:hypothetical protein CXB51_018821 [Gossypium anomalum]|uniref:DUF7745 domain-containing protein n=1 Tax=Gossypium anomalum TaxID=47600 RepID=A0A8J5YYQ3_9ROSI|nr:hypothetical protein CXB51_018821 [Gossypium anomalum]
MGDDRGICRFRYLYSRTEPHIVSLKEPTLVATRASAIFDYSLFALNLRNSEQSPRDERNLGSMGCRDQTAVLLSLWRFTLFARRQDRRTSVSSPRSILKFCLQLLHFRKGRFGTHDRGVHSLDPMPEDSGMSEQWVTARIKQKGGCRCIPWRNLRDLILAHLDIKKRVDVFTLSIYGLVIFPKALGHVDEAVSDIFDRLSKGTTPVPAILAETFRSLNACRRAGEGRFIGYAQLLLSWFHSHFWKVEKVSYRVFSENYYLLKELVATPRRDDITEKNWMTILQNLQEENIEWRAPWMVPDEILYRCGNFNWVPLLGIGEPSGMLLCWC